MIKINLSTTAEWYLFSLQKTHMLYAYETLNKLCMKELVDNGLARHTLSTSGAPYYVITESGKDFDFGDWGQKRF